MKKLCILVNFNLYESKRHFTQKLAEALHRKNIETKIIDVREERLGADLVLSIQRFEPDYTCSFNSILPFTEKQYLWDYLEIPHISFLVDPAFYSTHLINSPYSIITCVDRGDCEVIRASGFKRVFFLPHAIEREITYSRNVPREYDVIFTGSCYDFESLRASWRQRNPESINRVLDDAIDIVFSNDTMTLAEALVGAWKVSGLDPKGVDFASLYYYLDNYTRGKDRVELIRSIKNAHVHVFGELSSDNAVGILGWAPYLASQENVTVHPSVRFDEMLTLLKKSKIILNSMPFFRDGTHERIFAGLACGAFPISTESLYLREHLEADKEIVFYQSKKRPEVSDIIDELLRNEVKRKEGVESGNRKVLSQDTWDNRVEELLNHLQFEEKT